MADFCNQCAKEMFGSKAKPEIDVYNIASNMGPGYIQRVLCEGCEMIGVLKDQQGLIYLLYEDNDKDGVETKKVSLKEWETKSMLLTQEARDLSYVGGLEFGTPLSNYKLKVFKGIDSKPQMYHVIQEFHEEGRSAYFYLSEQEIKTRHKVEIGNKFNWIEEQTLFNI